MYRSMSRSLYLNKDRYWQKYGITVKDLDHVRPHVRRRDKDQSKDSRYKIENRPDEVRWCSTVCHARHAMPAGMFLAVLMLLCSFPSRAFFIFVQFPVPALHVLVRRKDRQQAISSPLFAIIHTKRGKEEQKICFGFPQR